MTSQLPDDPGPRLITRNVEKAAAMLRASGVPDADQVAQVASDEGRLTLTDWELDGGGATLVEFEIDLEVVGAVMTRDLLDGVLPVDEEARGLSITWVVECPVCSQLFFIEQESKPNHDVIGMARSLIGHEARDDDGNPVAGSVCAGTNRPAIIHPHATAMDHSHRDEWGVTTFIPLDDT